MDARDDFDFLLSPASTHELYQQHVGDDPATIARVEAALRRDRRPRVRRNAIVALTASRKGAAMADYVAALDDPAAEVHAEAAATVATWGSAGTGRPEDPAALAALRAHAPTLRDALGSSDSTVRYNAARALRTIADPEVALSVLLGDASALVRAEGVLLAGTRTLAAADVAALDQLARDDADAKLRWSALVQVVAAAPPDLAVPVLTAALGRGDVDRSVADAVTARKLAGAVPAIVAYLRTRPRGFAALEWIGALMTFEPPCAAKTLVAFLADPTAGDVAVRALRTLAGKPTATADELATWAATQREDAAPCS